jgi:hypothetical protein
MLLAGDALLEALADAPAWLLVGNIECAAAAFARAWFGLSPATHQPPVTSGRCSTNTRR